MKSIVQVSCGQGSKRSLMDAVLLYFQSNDSVVKRLCVHDSSVQRVSTSVLLPIPESVITVSVELSSLPPFCKSNILKNIFQTEDMVSAYL